MYNIMPECPCLNQYNIRTLLIITLYTVANVLYLLLTLYTVASALYIIKLLYKSTISMITDAILI